MGKFIKTFFICSEKLIFLFATIYRANRFINSFLLTLESVLYMEKIRQKLTPLLLLLLAFFPIVLWLFAQPLETRFSGPSTALNSIGQISGLVGMAMFSLTIIISSRPQFLDKLFNGLNNLYKFHHTLGIVGFLLLLVHPLSLAFSYFYFSRLSAAMFLIPGSDWVRDLGIFSLLGMSLLLVFTLYAKTKYPVLKFFHKFFGPVYLMGVLHTIFVKSDTSRDFLLHWYILGLSALALTAYCYKALFDRFLVKKYEYSVKEIAELPGDMVELVMVPKNKKNDMDYMAGQFVFASFLGKNISAEAHPFSIASSPSEKEMRIIVKSAGDYTSKMRHIKPGTKAKIEGPFGNFSYLLSRSKNQLWIAGGSGVAVFVGMLRDLANCSGYNIDLFYCTVSRNELLPLKKIVKKAAGSNNVRIINHCSNEKGYLNVQKISKVTDEIEKKDIFLCGPPQMIESLKGQFGQFKVPVSQIHSEEFKLL